MSWILSISEKSGKGSDIVFYVEKKVGYTLGKPCDKVERTMGEGSEIVFEKKVCCTLGKRCKVERTMEV